jgi:hypothetical protein
MNGAKPGAVDRVFLFKPRESGNMSEANSLDDSIQNTATSDVVLNFRIQQTCQSPHVTVYATQETSSTQR